MTSDEIPHKERIGLAIRFYGLYVLGFHTNETDCRCCMDNCKVPWLYSQLKEEQKEFLKCLTD